MYFVEYTQEDYDELLELSRAGAVAAFLYCKNVFKGGERYPFDANDHTVRPFSRGGVIFAPISFFTEFLGCRIEKCADACEIKRGEHSLRLGEGGSQLAVLPVEKGDVRYLPALETLSHLGFGAKLYYQGQLIIVGDEATLLCFDKNPRLAEAASYAVFGRLDTDSLTGADYRQAKDEWRLRLVGSAEINDLTDPFIADKISAVSDKCESAHKRMNRGDDPVILWGSAPPTESEELSKQYGAINDLARGWGTYGSRYYHNEDILKDIKFALRWMYENMYGEAEMENRGWRDVFAYNWWYWYVGGPEHLTDILLIVEEHLTMQEKQTYLKCFEWIMTVMRKGDVKPSCSSRMRVGTKTALLLEKPELLQRAHNDCDTLMGIEEEGEGPHNDFVQWTHGYPHNITYGNGNVGRTLYTSSILASTRLDFSGPKKYNQFLILKYMFEPAMYKGRGFMMFSGRQVRASERNAAATIMSHLLAMIGVYGEDEDAYIKGFIKRHSASPETVALIKNALSLYHVSKYNEILNDAKIPSDYGYEYAHAWFTGDRAAQHRSNYAFGIAMASEREQAYESINDQNKQGWYTCNGSHYLYTDYDDSAFDGPNFHDTNLNIAYRFPGTTEDSRPMVIRSVSNNYAWRNPTPYAGAMQVKDRYISAAMDYISMNYEGPDDIVDKGYGGGLAPHKNDLRTNKAWFCFDGELVCLGSGISSTMNAEVRTTLEHRRIKNPESDLQWLCAKGSLTALPGEPFEMDAEGAEWVLMNGHAGYYFFGGAKAHIARYISEEAGGQSFFELRAEHGINPENAIYAYAIIPYATEADMKKFAENPSVEILSNDTRVQAARDKSLGMTGYAFRTAASCGNLSASDRSLVTVFETDGEYEIQVCDLTHKIPEITFTVSERLELLEAAPNLTVTVFPDKAVIAANLERANGRSYIAKFRKI